VFRYDRTGELFRRADLVRPPPITDTRDALWNPWSASAGPGEWRSRGTSCPWSTFIGARSCLSRVSFPRCN